MDYYIIGTVVNSVFGLIILGAVFYVLYTGLRD